jgi:hypothetical protein
MMAPAVFAMLLLAVAVFQLVCKLFEPAQFACILCSCSAVHVHL